MLAHAKGEKVVSGFGFASRTELSIASNCHGWFRFVSWKRSRMRQLLDK